MCKLRHNALLWQDQESYVFLAAINTLVGLADVAPSEAINAAAHSEAVNQLEDVTKKASEALMNMYMSLSGANP